MNFIITQIIGGIGYSLLALSYFKKEKKQILFMQIVAYISFTIHYYMLSGMTGAICNLIGLVALIIIYLFDKYKVKNKKLLIIGMIPFVVAIALITFKDVFSFFPIIASVIVILSFISDNERIIRIIGVISALCWLLYAVVYKSYVAIAFEVITVWFVLVALLKNDGVKDRKKDE
ncbi:MAG: YgjV family protein [Clostridia bacterium]|nr:YgjV family protein [Clostridia bacterium]